MNTITKRKLRMLTSSIPILITNENVNKNKNSDSVNRKRISLAYQNPGGIENKAEMLSRNITAANYEIVIFTETWINDEDPNARFFPSEYVVHRQDRTHTKIDACKGGGTLIAIHEIFRSNRLHLDDLDGLLEYVAVELKINNKDLIIYNAYIRPITRDRAYESKRSAIFKAHLQNVTKLAEQTDKYILVIGDFNLPKIEWLNTEDEYDLGLSPDYEGVTFNKQTTIDFINALFEMGLSQMNCFKNQSGLELTLHLHDGFVDELDDDLCDYVFCYKKTDFDKLKEYIKTFDFSEILKLEEIDEMADAFHQVIEKVHPQD